MQEVLTQSALSQIKAGAPYNGIALIKDYNVALTKNGKEYIQGKIQSGVAVPFKAWGNSKAFSELKTKDYTNVPVYIISSGDDFGGVSSLIVDTVVAVEGFTSDQFLPVKYNIDGFFKALVNLLKSGVVSDKCWDLMEKTFFSNTEIIERFKLEFAATSHHDNCKGGLLAHTYKVVSLMQHSLGFYSMLVKCKNENGDYMTNQDMIDLMYYSALMHDVGKIWEMNFGVYQPNTQVVTHRYMIIEYMQQFREEIISIYDEAWWYEFVSAMLQHHGEFADPPRSLVALILHKVDCFDSDLTLISQCLESTISDVSGEKFKYDGKYYTV